MNKQLIKEAIQLLEKVTGKKVVLIENHTPEKVLEYSDDQLKGLRIKGELHGEPGEFHHFERNMNGGVYADFSYDETTPGGMGRGSRANIVSSSRMKFYPEEEQKREIHPKKLKHILGFPQTAYQYTRNAIKGRWPEAEKTIIQSPKYAYLYAKNIIKERWPEAEETIKKDDEYWKLYIDNFG